MPTTFHCPNCNAPLDYDGGQNFIVKCAHCNSSVVVPEDLRPPKPEPINITINVPDAPKIPAIPGMDGGSFAKLVFSFGGPGIGPGLFNDARSIAIDGAGYLFVADYTGGRVQKFKPNGEFVTLWMADPKMPLTGLAADRHGTVFVVQKGSITRYAGDTGESLGEMEYAEGWGFEQVTVAADGGLVTSWYRNRDDLVRFNARGQATQTIEKALSGQTDESELDIRVAVDGLDNIFALGTFHSAVFKFNLGGKYVSRFGASGDEPGQFRAPGAIAVDGQGRVYVADFKGIQVFDGEGRYLGRIGVTGPASGLAFDGQGFLWVVARTKVYKYQILK
jgi:DNA-binding beta-propeller fold protein YncE